MNRVLRTMPLLAMIVLSSVANAQWQQNDRAPIERTPETNAWVQSMSGTRWQIVESGEVQLNADGTVTSDKGFTGPEGNQVQITHWTAAKCNGSNHLLFVAKDVPGWRYLIRLDGPTRSVDGLSRKLVNDSAPSENEDTKPQAVAPSGIVLDPAWRSPFQGGENTIEDLSKILPGLTTPSDANQPSPDLEIYRGVTYLMPLKDAIEKLDLKGIKSQTKQLVVCPGLPKNSLYYVSYDGTFEGNYNRLFLVADRTDRVVCVQLMDESPTTLDGTYEFSEDKKTFNFICTRRKGSPVVEVGWKIQKVPSKTHVIHTALVRKKDKNDYRYDRDGVSKEDKPLELTRWYLPDPLASLALHCIGTYHGSSTTTKSENPLVGTTWRGAGGKEEPNITFINEITFKYGEGKFRYMMTGKRSFLIYWRSDAQTGASCEIDSSGNFFTEGSSKKWIRTNK